MDGACGEAGGGQFGSGIDGLVDGVAPGAVGDAAGGAGRGVGEDDRVGRSRVEFKALEREG